MKQITTKKDLLKLSRADIVYVLPSLGEGFYALIDYTEEGQSSTLINHSKNDGWIKIVFYEIPKNFRKIKVDFFIRHGKNLTLYDFFSL